MSSRPAYITIHPITQASPPSSGPKRKRKNGLNKAGGPPSSVGGGVSLPNQPPVGVGGPGMMMGAAGVGGGIMGPPGGGGGGPSGGGPEDYEVFTEGIMAQLRTMPQVPLMEPVVKRSFNECPPFGGGPMNGKGAVWGIGPNRSI